MNKKQDGFSAIEGLLIVVIIGLIGGTGWYVRKNNQDKPQISSATQSETKAVNTETAKPKESVPKEECEGSYKKLTNEKIGISFCYPGDWLTEVFDTASNHIVGTITLVSSDYKQEDDLGFRGSKAGSQVTISVYKIDKSGSTYTSVKSILDGTEQGKSEYSDVKSAKIAGIDGAKYISSYEGPSSLTYHFEHEGAAYYTSLEEDLDGPKYNDNQDAYQNIVESLKLTN